MKPAIDEIDRLGVEDIFFGEPSSASGRHTEWNVIEPAGGVSIRVDDELDAEFPSPLAKDPIEIEPARVGVDFDECPILCRFAENHVDIHGVGITLKQKSAGRMAEHCAFGMSDRRQDSPSHFVGPHIHRLMNAGDDVVE